jgi:hypothetical protein
MVFSLIPKIYLQVKENSAVLLIISILLIGYLKFSVRFRKIIEGNYKAEVIDLPPENLP